MHKPRYAGAYFYGRRRHFTDPGGRAHTVIKPREEWTVFIPDAHAGYISLERFDANQALLAANAASRGDDRRAGPPREGLALLQGLVVCGRCGRRMTVGYNRRCDGSLVPYYRCQQEGIATGTQPCQRVCGSGVDDAVAALVLEELSPLGIEAALAVSAELADRAADADRIRAATVERARHAAEAARRRYLAVDPTNRLVASTLEADWNQKLRELADAQDDYDRAGGDAAGIPRRAHPGPHPGPAADLPALWADPATPIGERKRLLRLLVTDVTLLQDGARITAHVRLPGGANRSLTCPGPCGPACVVRPKADTDSGAIRTPVPDECGYSFRLIPDT